MELYDVVFLKNALRDLKKLNKADQKRVKQAIFKYSSGQRVDVKKLQGSSEYRIRVGKFRIIFEVEGSVMYIKKIKSRGDVYKEEIEKFLKHIEIVLNEHKDLIKILEEIDRCTKEYAVADKKGKIKHFKGRKGTGERFANCIEYFVCKGYKREKAKYICALIAQRKCKKGQTYACGVKK